MKSRKRIEAKSYWFIAGEYWKEPKDTALVVTLGERPKASQSEHVLLNEVIDVHPCEHAIIMQDSRPNFVITETLQITRRMYEAVIQAQAIRRAERESQQAQEAEQNERDNRLENNERTAPSSTSSDASE